VPIVEKIMFTLDQQPVPELAKMPSLLELMVAEFFVLVAGAEILLLKTVKLVTNAIRVEKSENSEKKLLRK